MLPDDQHNRDLIANVYPADWTNPQPAPRYNLVVIGGGTAGLVAAAGGAGLGAKVALVERASLGGDCLNTGCVPSKALIRAARAFAAVRDAGALGVKVPAGTAVDFPAVMQRMRRLRASISRHDSAKRFRNLGIDVFLGQAEFESSNCIRVADARLRFKKAVIATGARASLLPIAGLADVGSLTNETLFSLTSLPPKLAIIGAGPIGCEMAQSFARFGSQVTLLEAESRILIREDPDASALVEASLRRDGVNIVTRAKITEVSARDSGKIVSFQHDDKAIDLWIDEILVGVGRTPNTEGLRLENVGVAYDRLGITVDDRLRTTGRNIYAAGDICSPLKFTHTADAQARIVLRNALFRGRAKMSQLIVPWCTYTDPEVAHVGLHRHEAEASGLQIDTIVQPFDSVDRAILDGQSDGFVKIHLRQGTDQIVGATIVASCAGDLISQITQAMTAKLGLSKLADTIHPYPTQAEAIKKAADAYRRTLLTPRVKWAFGKWLDWTR